MIIDPDAMAPQVRGEQEYLYKSESGKSSPQEILDFCELGREEQAVLDSAVENNDFSHRAISSVLKLSRTIADMEKSLKIKKEHLMEAIYHIKIFKYHL